MAVEKSVRGTPSKRSAEATRIPSHGIGRLMPPIKPGEIRNPGGRPKSLKDVQRLARKKSIEALTALIGVYTRPDGKLDRTADGKTVVAAASTVLKWAYGEPPAYDPNQERPDVQIDLDSMSLAERREMLALMDRVSMVARDPLADDDGPDFDPSMFASEPIDIEGTVIAADALAKAPKVARSPKPKPRPQRAQALAVAPGPVATQETGKRKRGRPVGSGKKRVLVPPPGPKRGRGRPRKAPV